MAIACNIVNRTIMTTPPLRRNLAGHDCPSCTVSGCPSYQVLSRVARFDQGKSERQERLPSDILLSAIQGGAVDWKAVYQLKNQDALAFFDCVEPIRWSRTSDPFDRVAALCSTAVVKITRSNTRIFPRFLFVRGVQKYDDDYLIDGSYADVYKASWEGKIVALKIIRPFSELPPDGREEINLRIQVEAVNWQQLHHPHIIEFFGVASDLLPISSRICLVWSWVGDNTTIMSYLSQAPYADRFNLMYQAATGIEYLHSREPTFIHGKIKPRNMLIDHSGDLRLTNFDIVSITGSAQLAHYKNAPRLGNTPNYDAPELLVMGPDEEGFIPDTRATDVFAFGMSIFEVFTDRPPFSEVNMIFGVINKIASGKRPQYDPKIPQNVWNIIQQCWVTLPSKRPDISYIVAEFREMSFVSRAQFWPFNIVESDLLVASGVATQNARGSFLTASLDTILTLPELPRGGVTCAEIYDFLVDCYRRNVRETGATLSSGIDCIRMDRKSRTVQILFRTAADAEFMKIISEGQTARSKEPSRFIISYRLKPRSRAFSFQGISGNASSDKLHRSSSQTRHRKSSMENDPYGKLGSIASLSQRSLSKRKKWGPPRPRHDTLPWNSSIPALVIPPPIPVVSVATTATTPRPKTPRAKKKNAQDPAPPRRPTPQNEPDETAAGCKCIIM